MNLGPDNCSLVLLLALTEQKILLHSLRPAVLTSVAEAVMQIIFPFYWQCPYIPLCPTRMSDYLSAPLPFVIGLDSRFFDLYDQPADVNAVDLDTNTVTLCEETKRSFGPGGHKHLPKRAARQLKQRLVRLTERCVQHASYANKLAAQMDDGALDFDFTVKRREQQLELEIREAFLHFMVSILSSYRPFLLPITSAPTVGATDAGNLFDQAGFLRSRDKSHHKFYNMLMRTQMFTKFIEERSFVSETNTCLAFFDECVDRAAVYQQRQMQGEQCQEPRFLLDLDVLSESDRTVFILPPEAADNADPDRKEYKTESFVLDPSLFPERDETVQGGDASDAVSKNDKLPEMMPQTPASALARRTKQEIRSAQKIAKRYQTSPYHWARCLINTSYSLWFLHLPGYALSGEEMGRPARQSLRIGLTLLQRMKRLRLHPADEICYRVMMQLCGVHEQPTLAVKVLFEMRNIGLHPNAVTYGHYNKAVLESEWPAGGGEGKSEAQATWAKIRNVLLAMAIFSRVGREKNFKDSRMMSVSTNAVDASSSGASAAAAAAALADVKADKEKDGVSQGSSSELSQDSIPAPQPDNSETANAKELANDSKSEVDSKTEKVAEETNAANEEEEENSEDSGLEFRHRVTSIVKNNQEEENEEAEEVKENVQDVSQTSPGNINCSV